MMRIIVACTTVEANAIYRHSPLPMKYLAIVGLIIAALVLSELLFDFYQWNQTQSCASTGGRNCGGGPTPINR
jgi:hypothetical protein